MTLPWRVKKFLDEHAYRYDLATQAGTDALRLQVVYLEDALGTLQVLFPTTHMLRLHSLAEYFGRNFTVMSAAHSQRLFRRLGIQQPSGVLPIADLHTLIDASVLDHASYLIDSGDQDSLLRIDQAELMRLIHDSDGEIVHLCSAVSTADASGDDSTQILRSVESLTSLRIRQRLEETLEIPPMPETARQILRLRTDPDARVETLAEVIERDPALNAQVICWASSPFYGNTGVHSVEDAIMRVLGFDMVLNMALGLSLGHSLHLPQDGPCGLAPYWEQAAQTAQSSLALVQIMPRQFRLHGSKAYLCGLLNNFGQLISAHLFPGHFSLVCRHIEANPHLDVEMIERLLLGVTRHQLAAWLLQHWYMSADVVAALRYQNCPELAGAQDFLPRLLGLTRRLIEHRPVSAAQLAGLPLELAEAQTCVDDLLREQGSDLRAMARQMSL